jgi:2-succinyl-6-hydroxy-2,4-cyclohexadiene-1-carboxylate synthase
MRAPFPVQVHGRCDRPALLFLHGFLGDRTDFQGAIARLSAQFYCLTVDLPGHGTEHDPGDSSPEGMPGHRPNHEAPRYTIPKIAARLAQWVESLPSPPVYLVGYSMGGRLALYLALKYPKLFPKAVIESASPGLRTPMERDRRRQHDEQWAQQIEADFPQFLRDWYAQPLFQSLRQDPQFAELVQRRSQQRPAELARTLRGMSTGRQPSLWDDLAGHRQPLLCIVGERDHKFLAINQQMVALCPTAQLVVVPQAGHNVHLENPQTFSAHLSDFFS